MFHLNHSPNSIDNESDGIARSTSAARFQIERVSDEDPNSTKVLFDVQNIPTSMFYNKI